MNGRSNESIDATPPVRRSPYGLEFALLIVLPVAVLLAGAATFALAVEHGFTPVPQTAAPIRGH